MLKFINKSAALLYRAGDKMVDHDGVELAGYLTFLSILSLFPFLVILTAIAGFIGQGELGQTFLDFTKNYLPPDLLQVLLPRIEEIISGPPHALLTFSILTTLWTASAALEGMRTVLNRAYGVKETPSYVWRRLMSILQLVLFTSLIILVMMVIVIAPVLLKKFSHITGLSLPDEYYDFLNSEIIYIGAVLIFLGVAGLYYWLPNIKQKAFTVLPGALLVVLLWIIGAAGVSYYITHISQISIIYGSLSGFIASMLFFFVMNLIFIYGAEFNHELVMVTGGRV